MQTRSYFIEIKTPHRLIAILLRLRKRLRKTFRTLSEFLISAFSPYDMESLLWIPYRSITTIKLDQRYWSLSRPEVRFVSKTKRNRRNQFAWFCISGPEIFIQCPVKAYSGNLVFDRLKPWIPFKIGPI